MSISQMGEKFIIAAELSSAMLDIAECNNMSGLEVFRQAVHTREYELWFDLKNYYFDLPYTYRVNEFCKELGFKLPYKDEPIGY